MGARRSLWLKWSAGAFLLAALAGWVFWMSLNEQHTPRTSVGAREIDSVPRGDLSDSPVAPGSREEKTGFDPRFNETLRTINEINRINKINAELRKNQSAPAPSSPRPQNPVQSPPPASDSEAESKNP